MGPASGSCQSRTGRPSVCKSGKDEVVALNVGLVARNASLALSLADRSNRDPRWPLYVETSQADDAMQAAESAGFASAAHVKAMVVGIALTCAYAPAKVPERVRFPTCA
jgi:hypothetical protein